MFYIVISIISTKLVSNCDSSFTMGSYVCCQNVARS